MLMIAKDESLFVVMDALNQVCRRRKTENSFRIRMILQVDLQQVLVTRKGLDTYLYCTSLTVMLVFLVAISHHIQAICAPMTIAQSQPHLG